MAAGPGLCTRKPDESWRACGGRAKTGQRAAGKHLASSIGMRAYVIAAASSRVRPRLPWRLSRQHGSDNRLCPRKRRYAARSAAYEPGSRACFLKTLAAAGAVTKLTSALAVSVSFEPAGIPAEKTVIS